MDGPLTRAARFLRAAPSALRLFRRNWPATSEDVITKAGLAWKARGELMFGELTLLKSRAAMMKGDDSEGTWAVAEAAVADVLLRLVEKELRDADIADRADGRKLLSMLEEERAEMASTARFQREVAATVERILGVTS